MVPVVFQSTSESEGVPRKSGAALRSSPWVGSPAKQVKGADAAGTEDGATNQTNLTNRGRGRERKTALAYPLLAVLHPSCPAGTASPISQIPQAQPVLRVEERLHLGGGTVVCFVTGDEVLDRIAVLLGSGVLDGVDRRERGHATDGGPGEASAHAH